MLKVRLLIVLVGIVIIYLGQINTSPFLSLGGIGVILIGAFLGTRLGRSARADDE